MSLSSIKVVTFDVFNTLIKTRGTVGDIYTKTFQSLFPVLLSKELSQNIDLNFVEVYKETLRAFPNFGYGKISSRMFWHQIVNNVFKKSGCHFEKNHIEKLADVLYDDFCTKANWDIFGDVLTLLDCLKDNNIKMGIISNFDERLTTILHNLNIDRYFDFVVCSREVGISKPNVEIFQLALKLADTSGNCCVHVGDNVNLDFHAARKLGINAYVINRSAQPVGYQMKSLLEIIDKLDLK